MKLKHGTSTRLADRALEFGLNNPFLTDDDDVAQYFAEEAVEQEGGEPVILEVDVLDKSKLRPDFAMYQEPLYQIKREWKISSDEAWADALKADEIPFPKTKKDWKTSLDTVSSVVHKGKVHPDQIDVLSR